MRATRRCGARACAVLALAAVALGLSTGIVEAQQSEQIQRARISGADIVGIVDSPNGQPFSVIGFESPDFAGKVSGLDCGVDAQVQLTGGPGGSPECILSMPLTSANFLISGTTAWPQSITATPFFSFDGRTYVIGSPTVINVDAAPSRSQSTSSSSPAAPPKTDQVAAPAATTTAGGTSRTGLWALLAGAGLAVTFGGVVLLRRDRPKDRDVFDELLDNRDALPLNEQVTLDGLTTTFDGLEEQLGDKVAQALSELAAFEQQYSTLFAGAMAHLDNYAQNYRPLIPQMKKIWDEFANRDWAIAQAEFAQKVVDGVQVAVGAMGAAKGLYASIEAAELAYAAEYAEGAALKLGTQLQAARAGRVVVTSGNPVGQAAARLAALRRQPGLVFDLAASKSATAVAKTATNTAMQNEKWIRSWIRNLGMANAQMNNNCQLCAKAGSQMVAKGTANVPFYLNPEGKSWAFQQGMVGTADEMATSLGKPLVSTNFDTLRSSLAAQPHGAQVWVIVSEQEAIVQGGVRTTKTVSHVFNGVNLNGTTFFFDVQTGAVSTNPRAIAAAAHYVNPAVSAIDATGAGF